MNLAQLFANVNEILLDMNKQDGVRTSGLFERIKEASKAVQGMFGDFIPVEDIRSFTVDYDAIDGKPLRISPLLELTSVKVNGITVSDVVLEPRNRHWHNGPYSLMTRTCGFYKGDSVEIDGMWGLYMDSESLGLSISQDSAASSAIQVENGSVLSPGMVLKIENEQELVISGNGSANCPDPTLATSLLNGEIGDTSSEQILVVDDGSEFYVGEVIRIDNEDICIQRIVGNSLTVLRQWNDSLLEEHADNSPIYVYRTFGVMRGVNGSTAASHDAAEVEKYLVPDDLNWICRQITGLMIMKAASGFQGRTGNSATGESMYFSEFPPNQIKTIKENYNL